MTIAVAVLVVAGVLTVFAATIFGGARSLRRVSARAMSRTHAEDPPPFGALPTLSDPVGTLGNPAPDADLSSNAESAREIYGE